MYRSSTKRQYSQWYLIRDILFFNCSAFGVRRTCTQFATLIRQLAGCFQLLSQRFRHFWWRRSWQSQVHFDGVIDEPLSGGERTNHDDPRQYTSPHTCNRTVRHIVNLKGFSFLLAIIQSIKHTRERVRSPKPEADNSLLGTYDEYLQSTHHIQF